MDPFSSWESSRRDALDVYLEDAPDAETSVVPARARAGTCLGDYRLEAEVFRGKNSSIFAALDTETGRRVAVKVLGPALAIHPGPVARFQSEAEIARAIRHPAVVPVYGLGCEGDFHFFALKLESGETLEPLRGVPIHERAEEYYVDIARRFAAVVDAVAALHQVGVVHRDIKPSNILIDAEGLFLLTDFGSALDPRRGDQDLDEWIGGTLYYMSPDQISPGSDPFDPAADVYSLGLTLYEVVTGELAFPECDDDALARWKLTHRPPAPRHANRNVPPGLEAIIRQAIDPHPMLRYRDACVMSRDLRRFVSRKLGRSRRHDLEF